MKNAAFLAVFCFFVVGLAGEPASIQFVLKVYDLDSAFRAELKKSAPDGLPPDFDYRAFKARIAQSYKKFLCGEALKEFIATLDGNSMMGENCDPPIFIAKPQNIFPIRNFCKENDHTAKAVIAGVVFDSFSAVTGFNPDDLPVFYRQYKIKSPSWQSVHKILEENNQRLFDQINYGIVIRSIIIDVFDLEKTPDGWKISKWDRSYDESTLKLEK
jgi:hypothetical protein